jgi:hypothetical protein
MEVYINGIVRAIRERDEETGEPLYWSNASGWSDKASATSFTADEINSVNLPIGGEWELNLFVVD